MAIETIDYDNIDALRAIMVGRSIVSTEVIQPARGVYSLVSFTLDNGIVVEAQETDGCGGCENGVWIVENTEATPLNQVITNLELTEDPADDGSSNTSIRLFIYADGIKTEAVTSTGTDNGYYGWGYRVVVRNIKS